jgi:hypothetical protein
MRKRLQLFIVGLMGLPIVCGSLSGPPTRAAGRITAVSAAASRNDAPVTAESEFYDSDLLVTRQTGQLRLLFADGAALRLGPETQLRVEARDARLKQTTLSIAHGRVRGISGGSASFVLNTPISTVASSLGADFEIIATGNLTELRVYSGKVTLTNTADAAHPVTLAGGLGIAATPAGLSEPFPVSDAEGLPENPSGKSSPASAATRAATGSAMGSATGAAIGAATGAAAGAGTAAAVASHNSATRPVNSVSNTNPQ